jgi:diguanylate cyclase (GGDEF)-like protein
MRLRHAEGSWCHIETIGNNMLTDPDVGGIVINARDTSDRRRLEEELAWQAYHDPLTGLPNRRLFLDRLDGALARARRSGLDVALLFIDLDDFKAINDALGHRGGDDVLAAVAQRLLGAVRPGDTVARLAGDEFTVVLEGVPSLEEAQAIATRIDDALAYPASVFGAPVALSASIGVALTTDGRGSVDELLRRADVAMYAAKAQGKSRHAVYRADTPR